MCGIVGYIGGRKAEDVLIHGLEKLEYRGYDSSGIAVNENTGIKVVKVKGKLKNLKEKLETEGTKGTRGIGHTRWATHGTPNDINSHPHLSNDGKIAVVHNGIIENYTELKKELSDKGITFKSETDTEVIPNLISEYIKSENDLLTSVRKTVKNLKGSYALGIISTEEPDKLIAVRKDSPLIVGISDNESFIASDVPAILKYTNKVVYLDDFDIAVLSDNKQEFFDLDSNKLNKEVVTIDWTPEAAEKGGYEHFTLKEIYEQPKALKDTMTGRIIPGSPIHLEEFKVTKKELEDLNHIYIVACGTAYHAGLVGKAVIEKLTRMHVETDVASEFRYKDPIIDDKTLVIVISQSGETADTLAVLRDSKAKGARVMAVTNVVGSSVARDADEVFYTWAGPEIGVASTKAYLTQLVAMYTIAIYFAELLGRITPEDADLIKKEMLLLPEKATKTLKLNDEIKKIASGLTNKKDAYYLGRGMDYMVALEASLKLKELTYIHSEGYQGGELKHGPIALIEDKTSVISVLTQGELVEKMVSNLKEVHTRGARILSVSTEKYIDLVKEHSDFTLVIPEVLDIISPVLSIIPLQLLAYHVATLKGLDVDKPRNLAKSVTVE
ncbi:MAG: glutamine--fructose-6-phosphate transaminase (isomerizing) [Clostridiaceae bacterium]